MHLAASGSIPMSLPNRLGNSGSIMEQDKTIVIRPSRETDVDAMLAIYRRHIRRGIEDGVDDSDTPQPDDLRERRKNLKNRRFPHVVASKGGVGVGDA